MSRHGRRRGSRGRNRVNGDQLRHLDPLPADPEELTPAELAWVRLVLKTLRQRQEYLECWQSPR